MAWAVHIVVGVFGDTFEAFGSVPRFLFLLILFGPGGLIKIRMKALKLILIIPFLISCNSSKKNNSELVFNVRKYLVKNTETYQTQNLDLKTIKIDSIKEYSKFLYLESKLKNINATIESFHNSVAASTQNSRINLMAIDLLQTKRDSINEVYAKLSTSENYYKCYASVLLIEPERIEYLEDYIINERDLDLVLNDEYEVIDYFFDLSNNLEAED